MPNVAAGLPDVSAIGDENLPGFGAETVRVRFPGTGLDQVPSTSFAVVLAAATARELLDRSEPRRLAAAVQHYGGQVPRPDLYHLRGGETTRFSSEKMAAALLGHTFCSRRVSAAALPVRSGRTGLASIFHGAA